MRGEARRLHQVSLRVPVVYMALTHLAQAIPAPSIHRHHIFRARASSRSQLPAITSLSLQHALAEGVYAYLAATWASRS